MSFNGDLYPTAGADVVMTTKGDMVDYNTARQRLAIGSANQILQVKSNLPSWETLSTAGSVLTTQGDVLYEGASALARLGQSTNFHTLATKGAGANPVWQASATSTMTAAQDVLYSSSANTLARLAAGSDGDVLTTHSTGSAPTWETPSGASLSGNNTWTGTNIFQDQVTFDATFSTWETANKTIASAKITMTTNLGIVDTEGSAATDDLNEALGVPPNAMFSLRAASAARTVVVKDTTGSVQFLGSGDFSMDNSQDSCTWCNFDGTHNYEIAESDNSG